jgi:hypothetical protein
MKTRNMPAPQMRVRTALIAGESIDACMRNLEYWTKQLEGKCSGRSSAHAPGYAPYMETEMKPWQAGSV